jgi:sec-independent protein translocase protein TatC
MPLGLFSRRTRAVLKALRSPVEDPPSGELEGGAEEETPGGKMSFLEHLDELRRRIIVAAIAICAGFLVAFAFVKQIYSFIMRPLVAMLPAGSKLIYTEPTEAFVLYLKMALLAGIILAAPVVLWQLWLFVAPGLYAREKKLVIPFVVLGSIGFVLGAAFSHYLLFPWTWAFLASFGNEYTMFAPKIEPVFSLYSKMMLGMGVVFQMPTVVYFLARIGLVTPRFLLRNFKYAILIIFIVAAVITPTGDMLTQTLFATPMIGLYIISIVIAWVFGKKREPKPAEEEA